MNLPEGIRPWHEAPWARLQAQLQQGRLSHAILLAGPQGLDKTAFADVLATNLLCNQPTANGPCGTCRGCTLVAAGSHPDMRRVGLEGESRQVRIGSIRTLVEFISLKSQYGGRRVGLVQPADQMNRSAANSLLKTLEEPPAGAILILVADRAARLPATVRSRCHRLEFQVPPAETALEWLQGETGIPVARLRRLLALAGGAPGKVAGLAEQDADRLHERLLQQMSAIAGGKESAVRAAGTWGKDSHPLLLELLIVTTQALIRRAAAGPGQDDAVTQLEELPARLDIMSLHAYLDFLYSLVGLGDRAFNPELYAEDLFIRWREVCHGNTATA